MNRNLQAFYEKGVVLLAETAASGAKAGSAEEALSIVTRACMDHLGHRELAKEPGNLKEGEKDQYACGSFFLLPGASKQILLAPHNYGPEQHYMVIGTDIGHPGWIIKNRTSLLLRNTDEHQSFVKILKTFRAGSVVYAPIEWKGNFLGQIICAGQARNVMDTADLNLLVSLANLAGALWMAHDGPSEIKRLAEKYGKD
jgi:hypothetical protein